MNHHLPTSLRRFGLAALTTASIATGGLVATLGAAGAASALGESSAHVPILTGEPGDPSPPDVPSLDDFETSDDGSIVPSPLPLDDSEYQGPLVTIPLVPGDDEDDDGPIYQGPITSIPLAPGEDDDGPIYQGPITSIPLVPGDDDDDDGPIYQGPIVTIPMLPGDDTPSDDPPATTAPPAEPPKAPETTTPNGTDEPTEPTEAPQAPAGPDEVAPFVRVTSASVECDGSVHVTYETGASPALAPQNDHVVLISPASNPAAVMSQRLLGREVNGAFTVDLQAPAAEGYHVFVVADFEPTDVDGVILVDEAEVPAPTNCPTPAG